MKNYITQIRQSPRAEKFFNWGKLVTITGVGQIVIQGTGMISGVMIIRLLPTKEYAFYTLANTMLGTMTLLSDGGISAGIMSQGGKVWTDKNKLGVILNTGLEMRKQFAAISFLIVLPILGYLLWSHGANWLSILLISLSLLPAFLAALSDSLLEIVPKLHQDINPLMKNQVGVAITRLILTGIFLIIFPFPFVAIIASGVPRIYGNIKLRKIAAEHVNILVKPEKAVKVEILKVVKRMTPGVIYYCLSGQITIWLISIFGNTTSIAEIGALSRLSMVLNIFTVLLSTLIIPRFAKLPAVKSILFKKFMQITASVIAIFLVIVLAAYLFPDEILLILGNKYASLGNFLFLSVCGSCLSVLAGIIFGLYTCRGAIMHPALLISLNILSIITGILLFDISTVKGIFLFNILVASVQFIYHTIFFFKSIISK